MAFSVQEQSVTGHKHFFSTAVSAVTGRVCSPANCASPRHVCSSSACAAPGSGWVCSTVVCAALDMSVLQQLVQPIDMSLLQQAAC
jgi:hypothetical protein